MSESHEHPPQQPDALAWKWVTGVTVGTIVLTIVLAVSAVGIVRAYQDRFGGWAAPRADEQRPPAGTTLEFQLFEGDDVGEGQRLRDAERARLESWGWVDREAGIVRMPIDDAIDLVLVLEDQP